MIVVKDIWHSLMLAGKNLMYGFPVCLVLTFLFFEQTIRHYFPTGVDAAWFLISFLPVFVQSCFIYVVNSRYEIDTSNGTFSFPRSDIENSLFSLLVGARYWNLMRTRVIKLSDIDNVYIHTKRWTTKKTRNVSNKKGELVPRKYSKSHVRYTINVTGAFGSQNLSFLDRQKRDEVRNFLQQAVKDATGKNIDRKISELS